MSANLRAFLATIRSCEGTAGRDGYRTIVGGSLFDDFSDHPRVRKSGTFSNGVAWESDAAGAYQFLSRTWARCKQALSLPDFSPASQDEAAIWLIQQRGALADVESGDLRAALLKCNREWASLPGSPYGQPTKTYEACERIYLAAGGSLTQPAGATPPAPSSAEVSSAPVPAPAAPSQSESTMPLPALIVAAASALLPVVSDLFRARGSKTSERNADIVEAAAPVLLEVAKAVVPGAANEQAAAEAILSSKPLQDQYRAAVALKWSDVAPAFELDETSRDKARAFALEMTKDGPTWRQVGAGVLLALLSLLVLAGGGWMLREVLMTETDNQTRGMIIGFLIAAATQVISYFFGSSASSRVKDQTISDQAKR